MTRVLLTGMTAAQVNHVNHDRSPNYPGVLHDDLVARGHEVTWCEPSVEWDETYLSSFDQVIVGVAPVTALGANRAYGALNVLETLWDHAQLFILVDAPDPLKMRSATQSLVDHPDNLCKPFFSLRKEFTTVVQDLDLQKRLLTAIGYLNDELWPTTIVPSLPWHPTYQLKQQLPNARVFALNLDRVLFDRFKAPGVNGLRTHTWAYEPGSHPSWVRSLNTTWPIRKLPKTHRKSIIDDTMRQLAQSMGTLITPSKSGTWWTPRYAMSLVMKTPVFSDWHETQYLSSAWTNLPSAYEEMSPRQRQQLATAQFESYVQALPEGDDTWMTG